MIFLLFHKKRSKEFAEATGYKEYVRIYIHARWPQEAINLTKFWSVWKIALPQ